jgi:pimeloyl-ACP methyl ester carboxylesterase
MSREMAMGTPLDLIETPCLIIAGEHDEFHESAEQMSKAMPNAEFVSLQGLDHIQAFGETMAILANVNEFLCKNEKIESTP